MAKPSTGADRGCSCHDGYWSRSHEDPGLLTLGLAERDFAVRLWIVGDAVGQAPAAGRTAKDEGEQARWQARWNADCGWRFGAANPSQGFGAIPS